MKNFCLTAVFAGITTGGAHAAVINGSFEADAVGTTAAPTGFTLSTQATSLIVDTNVTDGDKAVQISVDFPVDDGNGNNVFFLNALTQFESNPVLVSGQVYTISADVTVETADSGVTIQGFSGGAELINDKVNTQADASLVGVTQTVSRTFTYAGGDLFLAVQPDRPAFDAGTVTATIDNFSITVVPEPGSMLLLSLGSGLCLFRRRR